MEFPTISARHLRIQNLDFLVLGLLLVQNRLNLKRETLARPKFVGDFTKPAVVNGVHAAVGLLGVDLVTD